MIDYVYMETYGVKMVSFSNKITKVLYSKIRWLFILFGKKMLRKYSYFDKYMDVNKNLDIVNEGEEIYYKNYLGVECNDSFFELYEDSIKLAVDRINNLK